MNKKELVKAIKGYQREEQAANRSLDRAKQETKQREKIHNKLKKEKQEAITALEIWKSGCLEAQERVKQLENRINVLRQIIQFELAQTPIEDATTKEEEKSIIDKIIRKVAKKLITMEDKVKPFLYSYLPVPRMIKVIEEEKAKREKEEELLSLDNINNFSTMRRLV
jgi:hypothetical protein